MPANSWLKVPHGVRPLLVFLIASLLSLASFGQNKPLFPVTGPYPGSAGQSIVAGDFNGDGLTDLATLSLSSTATTITIFISEGETTPPKPATTSLNFAPFTVFHLLAIDINNDKELDLVMTTSNGVAVLLGNGDGTFQAPVSYAVPGAGNIAAVDLNGDGYPDVAIVTAPVQTSANIVVLLNQGGASGTLASPVLYPISVPLYVNAPLNITTGDFNGDGKLDIVAGDTQLTVFYGNGDGTLQTPYQATQAPTTPPGLYGDALFVATDLNHDGITDIAYLVTDSFDVFSFSLQVLVGHTDGKFTSGPSLPLSLSLSYPTELITAGTTNGGRNVDLAILTDKTTILLGDGNGGFTQGQSYALNGTLIGIPGSNGRTDLLSELTYSDPLSISPTNSAVTRLTSNGDGTFKAIPTLPVGKFGFATADLNGDGLTDVLTVDHDNNLVTALGRGDGTFTLTNRISGATGTILLPADFTGDGILDTAVITQGNDSPRSDADLIFYKGNGDGSFQPAAAPIDLQVFGVSVAIAGDFNGDGLVDIIAATNSALVFLPGKGNGIFGTQVPLQLQTSSLAASPSLLLAADLNNDQKLDLIWRGVVFLGQEDGTFIQSSVSLPGAALAVGDLNGDSIRDVVIGARVYAGNGDGTFQASPFYAAALPASAQGIVGTIMDTNADGHPDLLLQYSLTAPSINTTLTVALGDGKGNFTPDSNTYYAGTANPFLPDNNGIIVPLVAFPARLNNQVPPMSKDAALDYLTWTNSGATALLNQTNPAPTAPSPLPSKTMLRVSANSAAPTQQVTFTAAVTGIIAPTGNVSFTSNGAILGTAPVIKGMATLATSFSAAGRYSVKATYNGDGNNQPSSSVLTLSVALVASITTFGLPDPTPGANQPDTFILSVSGNSPTGTVTFSIGGSTIGTVTLSNSNANFPYAFPSAGTFTVTASYSGDAVNLPSSSTDTVTVMVPDFEFSTPGAVATIAAGQSATTSLDVIPFYGYHGNVMFSCGTLTSGETCVFNPPTVIPSNGLMVSSTIITTTTARGTADLRSSAGRLQGIAWAGILCLTLTPRYRRRLHLQLNRTMLFALLAAGLFSLSGCSASPSTQNPSPTNTGTPAGTQTIVVTATDSASSLSHSIKLQLTVK